jgi:hypothetical protein
MIILITVQSSQKTFTGFCKKTCLLQFNCNNNNNNNNNNKELYGDSSVGIAIRLRAGRSGF